MLFEDPMRGYWRTAFDSSLSIKSHQPAPNRNGTFGRADLWSGKGMRACPSVALAKAGIGCSDFSDMAGPRGPGAERRVEANLLTETKCTLRNFSRVASQPSLLTRQKRQKKTGVLWPTPVLAESILLRNAIRLFCTFNKQNIQI